MGHHHPLSDVWDEQRNLPGAHFCHKPWMLQLYEDATAEFATDFKGSSQPGDRWLRYRLSECCVKPKISRSDWRGLLSFEQSFGPSFEQIDAMQVTKSNYRKPSGAVAPSQLVGDTTLCGFSTRKSISPGPPAFLLNNPKIIRRSRKEQKLHNRVEELHGRAKKMVARASMIASLPNTRQNALKISSDASAGAQSLLIHLYQPDMLRKGRRVLSSFYLPTHRMGRWNFADDQLISLMLYHEKILVADIIWLIIDTIVILIKATAALAILPELP